MKTTAASAIRLRLDGREVAVEPGTTVAAALWRAGIFGCRVSVAGEPRGPVCGMGICFECRVTIDGVAHRRACLVACAPGMVIETGAAAGVAAGGAARSGAAADPGVMGGAQAVAPAGGGGEIAGAWLAGEAGAASGSTVWMRPIRADVAVVGAGPAGMAAACRAAEAGASVVLIDEAAAPGGQVWRRTVHGGGRQEGVSAAGDRGPGGLAAAAPGRLARRWLERLAASDVRRVDGAVVLDALAGPTLLLEQAGRAVRVEARRVVIATGARERFLPFPGWTLPNVVGVGGAQAMLKSGAGVGGRKVVVAGSGPLLLPVAAALARAGARILLVAEQAPAGAVARFAASLWRRPRLLAQAARYRAAFWRAPYRRGTWVSAAHAGGAPPAVCAATLTDGRRTWREPCDLLACAYGLVPNLRLARLFGCALGGSGSRRVVRVDACQQTSVPGIYCAGEPTGIGGLELALLTGQIAGLAAAGGTSHAAGAHAFGLLQRRRDRGLPYVAALDRAFQPRPQLQRLAAPDTIVCRCEDVPLGRLDPAWGRRQAKLYTRTGMGPCQGRVCGAALELLLGWDEPDVVRAPLEPVTLGVLAAPGGDG